MAWSQVSQVGRFPIYYSHVLEKCANHAAGLNLLSILLGKAVPLCRKKAFKLHKANKEEPKRNMTLYLIKERILGNLLEEKG